MRRMSPGRSKIVGNLPAQGRDATRNRQHGPWRLQQLRLRLLRRALALLPAGRKIPGRDRRAGWQTCLVRGEIHLWCRSAATISGRVPRWATSGAIDRLGYETKGEERPALASPLSE